MAKYRRGSAYVGKVKRGRGTLYKQRKSGVRRFFEAAGMIVVVIVLGVLGFAAGKPIMERLTSDKPPVSDAELQWTPPEGEDNDAGKSAVTDSGQSVTNVSVTPQTPGEAAAPEYGKYGFSGVAVMAPSSILSNNTTLSAYLSQAKKNGYSTVFVEVKDVSGAVWYKSALTAIAETEIVKGTMTLSEIKRAFDDAGVTAVARIAALRDPLAAKVLEDVSYRFADGSYKWMDAAAENGGKLWADPFLPGTRAYLSDICGELAGSGFGVAAYGYVFPAFRPYDLTVLPVSETNADSRYTALTTLAADMSRKVAASLLVEMSAMDIVNAHTGFAGTAEILRGRDSLPQEITVLAVFSKKEIGAELASGVALPPDIKAQATMIFRETAKAVGTLTLLPCVDHEGLSDEQLANVVSAIKELGYQDYIIK